MDNKAEAEMNGHCVRDLACFAEDTGDSEGPFLCESLQHGPKHPCCTSRDKVDLMTLVMSC
jgi:hypothetical protein